MLHDFNPGTQRRAIEDKIIGLYEQVDFSQPKHAYLLDKIFWDYVFSWYELVRYYELTDDTTIGAHMLELFAASGQRCREAVDDTRLPERRRDQAADALYQISYHINQMALQVERNAQAKANAAGRITWKTPPDDDTPAGPSPN